MTLIASTDLSVHPLAGIFPLMSESEFAGLRADIAAHGQREPISLYAGRIIDGRNRYNACRQLGRAPRTVDWPGPEAELLPYIISLNLHRRHLNESQRALVAARLANMSGGGDRPSAQDSNFDPANLPGRNDISQPAAAALLNVGERSLRTARAVLQAATPAVVAAVERGCLPVSAAAQIAPAPAPFQDEVARRVVAGVRPQEAIRQARAQEIAAHAATGGAPTARYRVLYADPPWAYGNTQPDYHTEQRDHYPVMSLGEICALPVREWAETDAVLFLWVTAPILEDSFQVLRAWGFAYKTCFVWDKVRHNMGHYSSVRHELLLLATRGSCQPDVRQLFDSVLSIERTGHSAKPEAFRELIDTLYPHGRRLELFARHRVAGWDAYGNQI